jgi:hypothetical protein
MIDLFKRLDELRGKDPCGIYHLKINNKSYIGSSYNIKKRLRRHRFMLKGNRHDNKHLQNLYNKYQTCEYEILELCNNTINNLELRKLEKSWIEKFNNNINLDCPVKGIGGTNEKPIYQYSKQGSLIKLWPSAMIAARELNIHFAPIHACANPNVKQSKSAYGYVWSYEPLINYKYECNTGSNLQTREVHLYLKEGAYVQSFKSLSDCARYIADDINYKGNWKTIRTNIAYVLQKPLTRNVRKKYKASYNKALTLTKALSTGS